MARLWEWSRQAAHPAKALRVSGREGGAGQGVAATAQAAEPAGAGAVGAPSLGQEEEGLPGRVPENMTSGTWQPLLCSLCWVPIPLCPTPSLRHGQAVRVG